ncbi:hypothetical protein VTN31DRAFT_940 [Thermomyces dupontii]|uniref:uncharacterized protein n=1 Tax=Talaromyces thermophilus TaxID=28565 RepID=UPI003742886B
MVVSWTATLMTDLLCAARERRLGFPLHAGAPPPTISVKLAFAMTINKAQGKSFWSISAWTFVDLSSATVNFMTQCPKQRTHLRLLSRQRMGKVRPLDLPQKINGAKNASNGSIH